jgi:CRP-like cAMP-binding protein
MPGAPVKVVQRVPLFADLNKRELGQVARIFKERRFADGETVAKEGAGGAAFFLIDSGEATVTLGGKPRATLTQGDYFGEIALIDGGARSATVTAASELVCWGLTYWDFRPLVQKNGMIGWKLLQSMAQKLRKKEQQELAERES